MPFNPQSSKWQVGDKIDNRYEIYRIKAGGMGIVYICYDHELKTPRVLKTFQEKYLISEQSQKLFEREALLWIELERFPYIVHAHLVDKLEGRLFIVLQYIAPDDQGRNTLTHFLDNLTFPEILKYGIQFCYGMEYAYSKGIKCHRDIKPDNIMITRNKTVKITDFGLAKPFDESEIKEIALGEYKALGVYQTKSGIRGGTLPYMAPEQFDGYADERSDIYAFGIVLYQMASGGRLPFIGRSPEEFEALQKFASIPLLSSMVESPERGILRALFSKKTNNSDVTSLFPIIKVCLEKNPESRFTDFNIIRQRLEQFLRKETGEVISLPEVKELDAWELTNKGYALGNLGRHEEAIRCIDEAIRSEPRLADAWNNKGTELSILYRYEEAIQCYDEAIKINPEHTCAWYSKASALQKLGRHQEAIDCCDKAIEIDPRLYEAWFNKGNSLDNLHKYEEAINCYDEAIKINPRDSGTWSNKGVALYMIDRLQEAINCLDEAIRINPNDANAWNTKGFLLDIGMHEKAEALECYNKALRINPRFKKALTNKGDILFTLKRYEEATCCFCKVTEIDPQDAKAWLRKGEGFRRGAIRCWRYLGYFPRGASDAHQRCIINAIHCFDTALEIYKKALDIKPQDFDILYGISDALYEKGKIFEDLDSKDEALNCFNQALEFFESNSSAWSAKGCILMSGNSEEHEEITKDVSRLEEAIQCFDRAISIYPESKTGLFNKAICLSILNRKEEEIHCWDELIKLDPSDPCYWINKGTILHELGRYESAIHCFDKTLEIYPQDPIAWRYKGESLYSIGNYDEAKKCFEKAIELENLQSEYFL